MAGHLRMTIFWRHGNSDNRETTDRSNDATGGENPLLHTVH